MPGKINPVRQAVLTAIDHGQALQVREIRALRAASKKAVVCYKCVFWAGIVIFNLALWVPLPVALNQMLLYVIAGVSLLVAVVVPIVGLRTHQLNLELLKVSRETPQKKTVNAPGRAYIEQVKKQDRPFVAVEIEALQGSKWQA